MRLQVYFCTAFGEPAGFFAQPSVRLHVFLNAQLIRGDPIGVSSDLWSAGIVLYVLLSGTDPFVHNKSRSVTFLQIASGDIVSLAGD